jgi:NADH dehydrogenase
MDVLLLDRHNYHLFQPLLYQVATGSLEQEIVAAPLRRLFRRGSGVRFRLTEVRHVDLSARRVITDSGPVDYDYLILAAGSVTNFFGREEFRRNAHDLKGLDDAVRLRNQLMQAFERAAQVLDASERDRSLTFVIVGGGPTGVEFAGALAELSRQLIARDYPELAGAAAHVLLVESLPHLLSPFPAPLREYALRRLRAIGVDVQLNASVRAAANGRVILEDGREIETRTVVWAAGVSATPLAASLNVSKNRNGRIAVRPDLSLTEHSEVFVVGDMAYLEQDGAPLPQLAPVAMQAGRHAAHVILDRARGRSASPRPGQVRAGRPFRYRDKGSAAVIGRGSAVFRFGGVGASITGFVAWVLWLGLHLLYLVGFRNRVLALLDWGFEYLRFDAQVRLITSDSERTG